MPTEVVMGALLLVFLVVLLLAGAGFAVHVLWWLAIIALIVWLAGFLFRGADSARWYRW
jgi:hypothetical protein